ncbi:Fibronectin type III domain protein [Legionella massiliensis]|uniref:Fibronectin type III domain protein n=1 Tax=Legionella massiliensis TaxID=1034943 RepID=A0A078L2P9_9GAMM|nr:fibronectin type III domain-containing protein [Legionella massiliensis]CDZ78394.1 Fibronectin type III domain protein [Legionella massiliensis]CEE14132.1 Fibronectin type III domain protein [Legionella massiliensis]
MRHGIQVLLASILLTHNCSSYSEDEPVVLPMFLVTPIVKAPAVIYSGQIVTASYRISNNSPNLLKNSGLVNAPFGLTQATGPGLCSKPFTLKPGSSCLLKLQIVANELKTNLIGGPLICSSPANPLYCAGPSAGNELNIIKENNPPPSTVRITVSGDEHEHFLPNTIQTVSYGATQTFIVTANPGYTLDQETGGNCMKGSWSGNNYTTGAVTYPCTLNFKALINSYALSTSGENLKVSPSSVLVQYEGKQAFTVSADSKYNLSPEVSGNCPAGSWHENTYTTGAITTACLVIFSAIAKTVPNAPTNITTQPANSTVTLSWTPPANDGGSKITGYIATSSPAGLTCSAKDATKCAITNLTNGTAYTFTVKAINEIGMGPDSFPSGPTTPATRPSAPESVTAAATNAAALLNWTKPTTDGGAAITSYLITPYIGTKAQVAITFKSNALTTTIKGLNNDTAYTFTVSAINAMGAGGPSTHSNEVTPLAPSTGKNN